MTLHHAAPFIKGDEWLMSINENAINISVPLHLAPLKWMGDCVSNNVLIMLGFLLGLCNFL